jgi:hypothetical protein
MKPHESKNRGNTRVKKKGEKNQTEKRRKDNKTLSQKNEKERIKTRKKTLKKAMVFLLFQTLAMLF